MPRFEIPEVDLSQYSNRQLAGPVVGALVVAILILAAMTVLTGSPVTPGIEFTGGTEVTIQTSASQADIEGAFTTEVAAIRPIVSEENTYIVTFQDQGMTQQQAQTELTDDTSLGANFEIQAVQSTSASFGESTQRLALQAVAAAFVLMSVVVFLLFRTVVPSAAVVLSALTDIAVPAALMNLFGIKLSLGTVAALLMLIGYSVDSDILLANHVLRRSGSFYESVDRAMQTGVTMTVTSIAAMTVMAIVSWLFGIELLTAIGTVLVLGLLTDLTTTYMMNVSLLRWYVFEGVSR